MKVKLAIFMGALLALLFFSSDFALIDIEKTAIIVGMGIDKTDGEYEITAQIAIPQASDTAAANDDAVITSKDKTVMEAIDSLGDDTGWYPKLSFCNLIVFGKELGGEDVNHVINHLLATEKIQNTALLCIAEGKAKEVLHATTPLDAISSFAIQKIIMKNVGAVSPIADANLKEFAVLSHSRSKSGFMPIIKTIKGDNKGKEGASSAGTASYFFDDLQKDIYEKSNDNRLIGGDFILPVAQGGSGESGGGGSEEANVVFDATSTAVFSEGKVVDTLSAKETLAFNLFNERSEEVLINTKDGDKVIALEIYGSKHKVYLEFKKRPTLKIDLELSVRLADSSQGDDSLNAMGRRATVPEKYCDDLEEDLTNTIQSFVKRLFEKETDLLEVREMIYRHHKKDYEDYKKIPLASFEVETDIKIKSKD